MEKHVVLFDHVRIVSNITMAVTAMKTMMMESAFGFQMKANVIQRNWRTLLELISMKNVTVMFILTKHNFPIIYIYIKYLKYLMRKTKFTDDIFRRFMSCCTSGDTHIN